MMASDDGVRLPRDLGTYYVRAEFKGGGGFIMRWDTSARFTGGSHECHPLDAGRAPPVWVSEDDLAGTVEFMFSDGNYSCDCNLTLFLCRASQQEEPEQVECGETINLERLTLIRPDGSERPLGVTRG